MAIDPSKNYLTRKACEKALGSAPLSRRESTVLSRHLNHIFQKADSDYANTTEGSFDYAIGDTRTIHVQFKRAIGGNDSASLSRDTLLELEPLLVYEKAKPPLSKKPATQDGRLTYCTHDLKTKDELGPQWKGYNELSALLQTRAEQLGKPSPLTHYGKAHIGHLAEQLQDESGVVHGVHCHKYKSYNRMTIAIHEDSIPALFDYLADAIHKNGHRSVNARMNNQASRGIS